jgi:hypothetical protein
MAILGEGYQIGRFYPRELAGKIEGKKGPN